MPEEVIYGFNSRSAILRGVNSLADGTTTATVLAQAMYREGVRTVAAGANPMAVKQGMEKAIQLIAGSKKGRPVAA